MNAIYCLDELPYRETNATALDNDASGKYIVLGGPACISVLETERSGGQSKSVKTNRNEINLLRWQHMERDIATNIASTSTQFIDVYVTSNEGLRLIGSTRAHPYNITDIDWCSYDRGILASSAYGDSVKFWDLRDLRRPCSQLQAIGGAEQVKWAPFVSNVLCTTHGTDFRIWDDRSLKLPLQNIFGHTQKICCVVWHPKLSSCLLTSGLDGYVKIWDCGDLTKPRHSLGTLLSPTWKIKFSSDGYYFASIPVPIYGQSGMESALSLWKTNKLDIVQEVKSESDVLLDVCWQNVYMGRHLGKCIYSVSRMGKLRKCPFTSFVDEVESAAVVHPISAASSSQTYEAVNIKDYKMHALSEMNSDRDAENELISVPRTHSGLEKSGLSALIAANVVHSLGTVPNSSKCSVAIISNKLQLSESGTRDELIAELQPLKNIRTPGLTIEPYDVGQCVLMVTYDDCISRQRISFNLSIRSTEEKCHSLYLEVSRDGSTLTDQQTDTLLKKISDEVVYHSQKGSKGIVMLSSIFSQLPNIVSSTEIFAPHTIDIPRTTSNLYYGANSLDSDGNSIPESINTVAPISTYSSPPPCSIYYDRWIPSPRTSGARFSGSGLLVVFGRSDASKRRSHMKKDSLPDEVMCISSDGVSMKSGNWKPSIFAGGEKAEWNIGCTPRSLDEYNHELHNSIDDLHINSQHLLVYEKCTSPLCQSIESKSTVLLLSAAASSGLKTETARTSSQQGMHPSVSSVMLGTNRSCSMQNVLLSHMTGHRRRGNSSTGILADDHHYLSDGASVSSVLIYDVSNLLSVSKDLARKYRLIGDNALQLCLWNLKVVEEANRKDLVKIWRVVELCVRSGKTKWRKHCSLDWAKGIAESTPKNEVDNESDSDADDENAFAMHPFGRSLINSLLDYFARINDYQTAAVVICILSLRVRRNFTNDTVEAAAAPTEKRCLLQHARSISTCTIESATQVMAQKFSGRLKNSDPFIDRPNTYIEQTIATSRPVRKLSSLLQNALMYHRPANLQKLSTSSNQGSNKEKSKNVQTALSFNVARKRDENSNEKVKRKVKVCSYLNPQFSDRFDETRQQYADLLLRWRMYSKAAEVMKFSDNAPYATPLKVRKTCPKCKTKMLNVKCAHCGSKRQKFLCSICQLPVSGLLTVCALCGHGGHSDHLVIWFKENGFCPYGCGCSCKAASF